MNTFRILVLCLITTFGYAQEKFRKTSQSIKVNKDVVVDLNTSYVEIELETWNKSIVEVEAYIESDKLSKQELQAALKAWNLKVDGSSDKVLISSSGGSGAGFFEEGDYNVLLRDLEFELADFPELPEVMVMPQVPHMAELPEIPEMPEMPEVPELPEFPELPELPKGIKTISFDYERYQKEGESYLKEWSKRYEKEGGKELQESMTAWARKFGESGYQEKMAKWGEEYGQRFEGKWAKDMEKWGEKFGKDYAKDMEKWGEAYGERFGKEWAEKMEAWGERFGREMERNAALLERDAQRLEGRAVAEQRRAERLQEMLRKRQSQEAKRESFLVRRLESGTSSKVRKVIKIKMPKKAKLQMNVRHGELKIGSLLHNAQGAIAHSFLVAENIDGGDTSINVSYSPVVINTWSLGTLNLNFVEKAQIKNAKNLMLNSKSSNVNIENLSDTAIIDGSFGDLTISNLMDSFRNLNLLLENSDALINLPKTVDYTLFFKGNRSKYNNKLTSQKTIRNYPEGETSDRNIMVNAKFSNVIIN